MELRDTEGMWSIDSSLDDRPPDIIVCVGSRSFNLHKDVLIEHCDYFKAMFSSQMAENAQEVITIKLIKKYPFEILVHGLYSGQLELTVDSIFEITLAAHVLQVADSLFQQCCDFMKSMISPKKCFEIMNFSEFHSLQDIYDASRRYCVINFNVLCEEDSFLNLSINQVVSYLSDEFLVADGDYEKLQALAEWCNFNDFSESSILHKAIVQILHNTNDPTQLCEEIANKLSSQEKLDNNILSSLGNTSLYSDMMMFWARLLDSKGEGLVDVVKLSYTCSDSNDVKGVRVDTMTQVVEKPGFDLGSAVCCKGPYVYVCGGGPNFGRMDWIRDIWRYNVLEDSHRWKAVGKLQHPLRYHAMIPVGTKLYIFGGFGKFRSKNCNLDSLDIVTGVWSQHASVPTWEIKPVATQHHQTIYYVCREWNIHAYNTASNHWTDLDVVESVCGISDINKSEPLNSVGSELSKPLSCFISPAKEDLSTLKLVVLSQGNHFQTQSFKIGLNSTATCLCSLESVQKHSMDMKSFSYFGSCVLEDNIVVLFKKLNSKEMDGVDMELGDDDDNDQTDKECTPIHVMNFSQESGELKEGIQIVNNIVKTQSVVAVPMVPKTFKITASQWVSDNENGITSSTS